MAAYNPCYCWNLKDGCITIGIWSLVYSLTQIGLFGWQSYILQGCRQLLMIDSTMNNCQDWCPCSRNPSVGTTITLVEGIFIVQILNLIAAFFLLFASAALIYGVHTNSKHLVWPWFPCIVCSIACSAAYCIMWWAGNVESYWLVLTIVEFLALMVNLYCLLCVIIQYRRIVKGYVQQTYDDDYKPKQLVYEYRPRDEIQESFEYYPEKKNVDGYHNATYEPDLNAANKVSLYKGGLVNAADEDVPQPHVQGQPTYQYQPYQQQQYRAVPQQAQELPVKSVPVTHQSPELPFKTRFTEAWIKGVNNANPDDPKAPIVSARSSPERPFKRTKSLDAIQERSSRRKHHHRIRSAKSKDSVSSRHSHRHRRKSSYSSTSESSSSDDDETATERSYRKSRHRDSDSDTGYSASVANSELSSRRHGHRHRRSSRHKDQDKERRKHRRPRDVKREDKERGAATKSVSDMDYEVVPPVSASEKTPEPRRPPAGGVPVLPTFPGTAGGITIPQHIVIPSQPKGAKPSSQPQRYHINSEITIRYNNDGVAVGQEPDKRPTGPNVQPVSTTVTAPSPQSTASTMPIGQRATNIDSSGGDSKGYSSTAV